MGNDTNTLVTSQADDTDVPQPQAGNTPPEPQAGDGEETLSLDEAKKLRSEAANLRKRLKETESKAAELDRLKAEIEASKLSESERLQQQYKELKEQFDDEVEAHFEARMNNQISQQALSLGVKPTRTDLVARLINWEDIEIDTESGEATNIRTLVENIVKEFPEMVGRSAPASGGATNPPRSQTDGNTGEITASYVADLMSGKIPWQSLTPERRTAVLNWQAKHPFRF